MNGKKFLIIFVLLTAMIGALMAVWIKQGFESRPKIQIKEEK